MSSEQEVRADYESKILGIRNYVSRKKEFYVEDLVILEVLEIFLNEVATGESDITPTGKAFLDDYFGIAALANILFERDKLIELKSIAVTCEDIEQWLRELVPMATARFIAEAQRDNQEPN